MKRFRLFKILTGFVEDIFPQYNDKLLNVNGVYKKEQETTSEDKVGLSYKQVIHPDIQQNLCKEERHNVDVAVNHILGGGLVNPFNDLK